MDSYFIQWIVICYYHYLMLKLSKIWGVGDPWSWVLCLFDTYSLFSEYFLIFWHNRMLQAHLVCPPRFLLVKNGFQKPRFKCQLIFFFWGLILSCSKKHMGTSEFSFCSLYFHLPCPRHVSSDYDTIKYRVTCLALWAWRTLPHHLGKVKTWV